MSVVIETSLGLITIDLYCEEVPLASKNFLKLCKSKYYNNCIFHNVQRDLLVQTGDPTWRGTGGESIYGQLLGEQARYFEGEPHASLTHARAGTVSMALAGKLGNKSLHGSQWFITTRDALHHFDGVYTVIGNVAEGMDVVQQINEAYTDDAGRPYRNIRIKHVAVLFDPFDDPPGLVCPPSPVYKPLDHRREADEPAVGEMQKDLTPEQLEEQIAAKEALSRATVLEMVGDLPDAEAKPPDEVLFVCKLNPVTRDEDLELIFGRFGPIRKAEIIRDPKTGASLHYGFIEFEDKASCVAAYTKMDNVLIDERRIHVDFCQSVAKIWRNRRLAPRLEPENEQKRGHRDQKEKSHRDDRHHRRRSRSRSREKRRHRSRSRSRSRDRDRTRK